MYQWCKENVSAAESVINSLKDGQISSKSLWFTSNGIKLPHRKIEEQHFKEECQSIVSQHATCFSEKKLPVEDFSADTQPETRTVNSINTGRKRKASQSENDSAMVIPSEKKLKGGELLQSKNTPSKEVIPQNRTVTLSAATLDTALKIKDAWTNEQRVSEKQMSVFVCHAEEMKELCCVIGASDLTENSLSVAFGNMVQHASCLSYANTLCFIESALVPKLNTMSKPASRVLLDVLCHITETFPMQMLEGVFLHFLQQNQIDKHLSDLLLKLIKSELPGEVKKQFLVGMLQSDLKFNDVSMVIVQLLVDHNITLDDRDLIHLISMCEKNCVIHQSNRKYGKFLMSVVMKYRKQLTPSQIGTVRHIIESHKSFLKNSLLAALNKS